MNILQVLTQAYYTERNSGKRLDKKLLEDMANILTKEIKNLRRFHYKHGEGIVENKFIGSFILIEDIIKGDEVK